MSEQRTALAGEGDTALPPDVNIYASNDDFQTESALDVYLSRIKVIDLLDASQEQEMARAIEAGRYAASLLSLRDPETREAAAESLEEGLLQRQQVLDESREPPKRRGARPPLLTSYPNPEGQENRYRGKIKNAPPEPQVETLEGRSETIQTLTKLVISLSEQEVQDMQELVGLGDKALNEFWQANLRLVVTVANRYRGKGVPLFELIQQGNLRLRRAVEKFDYKTGYKFSTYATWWIRSAMTHAIHKHAKERSRVVSMNESISEGSDAELGDFRVSSDAEGEVSFVHERATLRGIMERALSVLDNERDVDVIRRRYGFPPYDEPQTQAAVADAYGVTRPMISRIEKRVINRLSKMSQVKGFYRSDED